MSSEDNTSVLPCPFCGGEATTGYGQEGPFVNCVDCLASTNVLIPLGDSKEEAIERWNRRVST